MLLDLHQGVALVEGAELVLVSAENQIINFLEHADVEMI